MRHNGYRFTGNSSSAADIIVIERSHQTTLSKPLSECRILTELTRRCLRVLPIVLLLL